MSFFCLRGDLFYPWSFYIMSVIRHDSNEKCTDPFLVRMFLSSKMPELKKTYRRLILPHFLPPAWLIPQHILIKGQWLLDQLINFRAIHDKKPRYIRAFHNFLCVNWKFSHINMILDPSSLAVRCTLIKNSLKRCLGT